MSEVLSWIAHGLGGLLFVATVVAWWEHLGRLKPGPLRSDDPSPVDAVGPRARSVDIDLDATPPGIVLSGDAATRQGVLDGALSRMSQGGSTEASRSAWIDTAPMIGKGLGAGPRTQASAASEQER